MEEYVEKLQVGNIDYISTKNYTIYIEVDGDWYAIDSAQIIKVRKEFKGGKKFTLSRISRANCKTGKEFYNKYLR